MSFHRIRMPFGKHGGQLLGDVPLSYLCWVLREIESLEDGLRAANQAEVKDRTGAPPRSLSDAGTGPSHAAEMTAFASTSGMVAHP